MILIRATFGGHVNYHTRGTTVSSVIVICGNPHLRNSIRKGGSLGSASNGSSSCVVAVKSEKIGFVTATTCINSGSRCCSKNIVARIRAALQRPQPCDSRCNRQK